MRSVSSRISAAQIKFNAIQPGHLFGNIPVKSLIGKSLIKCGKLNFT
jgi:hypothetical protein